MLCAALFLLVAAIITHLAHENDAQIVSLNGPSYVLQPAVVNIRWIFCADSDLSQTTLERGPSVSQKLSHIYRSD